MTIQSATPYFILRGKAAEAIEFYGQALGAKVELLTRFGDMQDSCPEAMRSLVMHATLRAGNALLMLSDGPGEGALVPGGAISVALDFGSESELRRVFDALADGGTVFEKIIDAPWGALFAVVTDRFGIAWMLNFTKPATR